MKITFKKRSALLLLVLLHAVLQSAQKSTGPGFLIPPFCVVALAVLGSSAFREWKKIGNTALDNSLGILVPRTARGLVSSHADDTRDKLAERGVRIASGGGVSFFSISYWKELIGNCRELMDWGELYGAGEPPLSRAAMRGEVREAERLMDCGFDVNEDYKGFTPLMRACFPPSRRYNSFDGNLVMIQLLLKRHADVNARVSCYRHTTTPLTLASFEFNPKVIRLLLGQSNFVFYPVSCHKSFIAIWETVSRKYNDTEDTICDEDIEKMVNDKKSERYLAQIGGVVKLLPFLVPNELQKLIIEYVFLGVSKLVPTRDDFLALIEVELP